MGGGGGGGGQGGGQRNERTRDQRQLVGLDPQSDNDRGEREDGGREWRRDAGVGRREIETSLQREDTACRAAPAALGCVRDGMGMEQRAAVFARPEQLGEAASSLGRASAIRVCGFIHAWRAAASGRAALLTTLPDDGGDERWDAILRAWRAFALSVSAAPRLSLGARRRNSTVRVIMPVACRAAEAGLPPATIIGFADATAACLYRTDFVRPRQVDHTTTPTTSTAPPGSSSGRACRGELRTASCMMGRQLQQLARASPALSHVLCSVLLAASLQPAKQRRRSTRLDSDQMALAGCPAACRLAMEALSAGPSRAASDMWIAIPLFLAHPRPDKLSHHPTTRRRQARRVQLWCLLASRKMVRVALRR